MWRDEVDPSHVQWTFVNLSSEDVVLEKYMTIISYDYDKNCTYIGWCWRCKKITMYQRKYEVCVFLCRSYLSSTGQSEENSAHLSPHLDYEFEVFCDEFKDIFHNIKVIWAHKAYYNGHQNRRLSSCSQEVLYPAFKAQSMGKRRVINVRKIWDYHKQCLIIVKSDCNSP